MIRWSRRRSRDDHGTIATTMQTPSTHTRIASRRLTAASTACAIALLASVAQGQAEDPPGDAGIDAPRAAIENPDVYVNDSFEAADALAKAKTLTNRGRWSEAAQLLQRSIDRAEHRLVRVAPGSYVGIRRHISDSIAGWPKEGLSEYRRLFERELESEVEAVTDSRAIDELLPLFERYFCTAHAARLAETIAQMAIEAGNLTLAEQLYQRVVDGHPDAAAYSSRYRGMLAILAAIRREAPPAVPDDDGSRVRWMGQDRPLREVLSGAHAGFAGLRSPAAPEHWPIFAGEGRRNRTATCRVDDPGLLWRVDLMQASGDGDEGPREAGAESKLEAARELTLFPVVSDGVIYVQWRREIAAIQGGSGAILWRFGSNSRRGRGFDYLEDSPPGWDCVTVHDGRVYASLPGDQSPYHNYDSPRAVSELVSLDARSGRLIWLVNQRSTDDPMAEITFDSSPLVRDRSVYIVGRKRRAFGFEDCYLYRLSAVNGSIEYRTHLGSASTGSFGTRPATRAIPALNGDTVYVSTNLGTVAAVSAHTGDVLWLRLYERFRPDSPSAVNRAARDVSPWQFSPVIVANRQVVFAPMDGPNLLVLSAENGDLLRSVSAEAIGEIETLVGVRDDLLYGVAKEAFCYDLTAGAVRWTSPLPAGGVLFGRGTWTGDELLIPRRNGLSRFRLRDGSRTDAPWDAEGEGGNLTALPDMLIAAGVGRVAGYVRKAEIWNALRERMVAAAADPLPALELAEVALNIGEYAEAVRALDAAVRRADQDPDPPDPVLADRFLTDAMKLATTLAQRSTLEADALEKLFAVAAQFARNAELNLRYRFTFAELFEKYDKPDRSVRVYQQVLRDRSLRELSWPAVRQSERSSGQRAGAAAQARIAKLIERHGRRVYAPYEAEAGQWLNSGRAGSDAELLQRVVDSFPNSESAPAALLALGELAVRDGRVHVAARYFSRAYTRYPQEVDRPGLLRKIADAYERAGIVEHAYSWLGKAAREYPTTLVEHEGRALTFAQYRERLAGVRQRVEPSRPTIRLPLDGRYERTFDAAAALLNPTFGDDPSSRWSRFFVQAGGAIHAFDSRSGDALWPQPVPLTGNAELLIARDSLVIFATPHEVFALDTQSGVRRWVHGDLPKHLADPGADWEAASVFRTHSLRGNRLVSTRDDGTLACILVDSGKVLWTQAARLPPSGRVRVADAAVAYHAVQDGRGVVCLIDAETGSPTDPIVTDENRPIEDVFLTLDGQIIVVTSQSISAYDPDTRSRRWQTPVSSTPRLGAMYLDLDAFYICGDDGELRKLDLDDGKNVWRPTERLVLRGESDLTAKREGVEIIVSTTGSVSAVDSVNGLLLWRGTTPEKCRLTARAITDAFVVAVDLADGLRPGHAAAYFYDHRNHSGAIPQDGAPDLGELVDVRTILALDDALVIQTGSTIRGFAHK